MIHEAIELASSLDAERVLGEVLMQDAVLRFAFCQQRREVESGMRAGDLMRAAGDVWNMTHAYAFGLRGSIELGRFDTMSAFGPQVEELGRRWGVFTALLVSTWVQAMTAVAICGDLDGFEGSARAGAEVTAGLDYESAMLPWLGIARFLRGDWEEAERLCAAGAEHELPNRIHGTGLGPLLQVRAYLGDRAGALEILQQERANLPQPGMPAAFGSWQFHSHAVEVLAVLGAREQCAALYPVAEEFVASGAVLIVPAGRLTQRIAGTAAACGGLWEVAHAHFAAALRQADELPHRLEYAETRRFAAMMLLERGEGEQAGVLLAEADARYRELGMPRHIELVAELLSRT
jgi:tetratricopeptide (TPR) repeat protein